MTKAGANGEPDEHGTPPFQESEAIKEIVRRCEAHGIEVDEYEPDGPGEPWEVCIMFPEDLDPTTGLTDWEVFIEDGPHAELALSEPFETYRRLRSSERFDGDALWSPSLGAIECPLTSGWGQLNQPFGRSTEHNVERVMRALGVIPDAGEEGEADAYYEELRPPRRLRMDAGGLSVSIGPCSNAWALWANATGNSADGSGVMVNRILTLRVEGAELPSEEAAVELLERIVNAALFELGRESDVGLVPSRRPLPPTFRAEIGREGRGPLREPPVVRREYDARPMSLYWYAEEATRMPLLRFLTYYQILEFYFPAYSVSARLEAVRSKLSEIAPGGVRESDVEAVLEAAGITKKRLLLDERAPEIR